MEKMYSSLAGWYRLLTPVEDYKEEAEHYHKVFDKHVKTPIKTMLELGVGAGHNAYYLKKWYQMTLTDLSPEMLEVSKEINPECEHIEGDMRSMRLEQEFDAVFIHDAIAYMCSEADLKQAMETAFVHLKPGGVLLIAPDATKEDYTPSTTHGGSDGKERAMRYLEWDSDPDPNDTEINTDYIFVLRDEDGNVTVEYEQHTGGLFSREVWLRLLGEVGFKAEAFEDTFNRRGFVGVK